MNPSKRPKEPAAGQGQGQEQEQDISSIWSSLGRLRAELRRMEHRLDGAGEVGVSGGNINSSSAGYLHHLPSHRYTTATPSSSAGSMPGVSSTSSSEQSSEAAKHPGSSNPHLPGTRRKVSRLAEEKACEDGTSSQTPKRLGHRAGDPLSRAGPRSREPVRVNHDHHGIREESPKRVDFSKTHQLREVNWDGTYQDSLAYPSDSAGSSTAINSTITNSRDIRETDIHFLNFSRVPGSTAAAATTTTTLAPEPAINSNNNPHSSSSPPFAPPPSASNSVGNFHLILAPSSPSSSLPSSSSNSLSSTSYSTHQSPDVRWAGQNKGTSVKSGASHSRGGAGKSASGKSAGAKLTHVELQLAGSARTGHSAAHGTGPSLVEQKHKELLHIRKQVEEKWAGSNRLQDKPPRDSSSRAQARPMETNAENTGSMDTRQEGGAVGGAEAATLNSPKRPRPMKMSITADLKEDEIMLKLKERLKQQRAQASCSSLSGSNDTSLTDSSASSAPPPALPPRQPLTGDSTPGLPMTRKIAAAHPTTSYRGFSDATAEHSTAPTRSNTKVSGVKKKGGGGGAKKPPALQPKKHDSDTGQSAKHTPPPPPVPERPKKVARVVASGDKKSSKSGAKNIITTSSWRAGQELIMKELGMTPKVKAKSTGQSDKSCDPQKSGTTPAGAEGDGANRNRQPDGAEADTHGGSSGSGGEITHKRNDPMTDEVMANARALTEDARNMLSELQLGNAESTTGVKSPSRPAVKRKAPKATEPEKRQQPKEKSRHYDPDSVRKFMAKQKAERLKKQHDEKVASQKANEKKQQMMNELVEKQKQVVKSASHGRGVTGAGGGGEGDRKRKKDGRNAGGKENVEAADGDHDDDSTLTGDTGDSTPQATTPRAEEDSSRQRKRSKDNDVGLDYNQHALNQTTTIATATTTALSTTSNATGGKFIEFKGQLLNFDINSALNRFSQVVKQRQGQEMASSLESHSSGARTGSTEFQLQGNNVFAGPHNPGGSDTAFGLGTSNSMARTNEERKQAIKATALTLQSRLAEERKKLEEMKLGNPSSQLNVSPDFMSRYNRIVGNNNEFAVFSSDLPGSQPIVAPGNNHERQDQAAVRIQAAYRGHNVRQALNWELPSGQTFGQKLRGISQGNKEKNEEEEEDASELTETSTFSEITATEASDGAIPANVPGNRRTHSNRHERHGDRSSHSRPTVATYQPPTQYTWSESKPDPYSVMSVFSRQNRYLAAGSRQADMPYTNATTMTSTSIITATTTTTTSTANPAFVANLDLTSLKQPVITSTERVVYGHTSSGQPVIAKARYTRVEATVSEKVDDLSQSDSVSDTASPVLPSKQSYSHQAPVLASVRSNDPVAKSEKLTRQMSEKSGRTDAYSMEFESFIGPNYYSDTSSLLSSDDEDDAAPSASNNHSTAKMVPPPGYNRQVSDAGLESDISQMSEDEPRAVRSKLDSAASTAANRNAAQDKPATFAAGPDQGQGHSQGGQDGRLSPNSLANKFSANLNYLESMEESLRQVVGMERARSVALAQQESVSLAQVLKARQQEHSAELRSLQAQVQQEAREATQQLDNIRSRPGTKPLSTASSLLEKEDNRRPESRSYAFSVSRSSGRTVEGKEDLSQSPGNRRIRRSPATTSLASVTKASSSSRTPRDRSSTASVKTAEDTRNDSDSSIRTASDADAQDSHTGSIPEEVPEEEDSYSMSFDESVTEVLPSESHRKELRRQSGEFTAANAHDASSSHLTPYGDLSSLFVGEDSFNKFTAEMVRQIMREEEFRAQHQAALLNLREKALKEKAKAELAWLQQLKQKPPKKGADDVFPNLDKREQKIKKNLQEQQAEIRRLQEANKMASKERQMLLQQHEEIAKIKQNTQQTLSKLKGPSGQGRLARPSEVHTEDEIEEASDVSEDFKDSKSDSEMYRDTLSGKRAKGDKKNIEKQQKLRLDQKYMTAREHKLHDRKKHAKELLEWKKRLDEEEEKIYKLERKAIQAWGGKNKEKNKKEETAVKKAPKVTASKKDDSHVISDHMLSSMRDELPSAVAPSRSRGAQGSVSEAISTQISVSKSETTGDKKSRSRSATEEKDKQRSPGASGSESSIPEEVPTGTNADKQKNLDSSDDTLINSSANDDYADTFEHDGSSSLTHRKKSPVGRLLPHGNSPLPTPWSRKTGSESESEDSISHTETLSDASDYEVRIRQLSDELRRRRKEVELLKKERSKRQKEKLKAQEEALKKQLEAYNNYIQQLKLEKDDLEHETQPQKAAVKPQIKQPRVGNQHKTPTKEDVASNSSSFEDMRDGVDSNQTSPSVDGKDMKISPVDEKAKKKASVSLMDRISEGSESQSDKSGASGKFQVSKKKLEDVSEKTSTSSMQEVIEEASQLDSLASEKTASGALKIQTSLPATTSKDRSKAGDSVKEEDHSYSMDFSEVQSSLAQSHSKVPLSARSQGSASHDVKGRSDGEISEYIEEAISVRSQSLSSQLKVDAKPGPKDSLRTPGETLSPPATGIQESDSETESRVNSIHTSAKSEGSSRPSSERSVGSISYSPEDEEEEEDIISYGSDKAPAKSPQKLLPPVPGSASAKTDEDISEHISASLPSITDRQRSHSGSVRQEAQDLLDSVLGYSEEEHKDDDDDKTPVPTPREMAPTPVPDDDEEEENASLLQTDPLADFHLGDHVLVWGRRPGVLRYKGKVDFSPGIWAGVELDAEEGDSDGLHEGKRYFTCPQGHGVMVHGSDIVAASEKPGPDVIAEMGEARSPDESLTTDQEDSNIGDVIDTERTVLPASDASILHSTPVSSPHQKGSEKPTATPVKRDMTLVADSITDQLTTSLVEDSVDAMGKIASKKVPPATLPKPAKKPSDSTSPAQQESPEQTTSSALTAHDQAPSKAATDKATDGVMKSLLEEAITDMMKIKRRKAENVSKQINHSTGSGTRLVNGDLDDKDIGSFFDDDDDDDDEHIQDNDSGLSLDPVQRPGSPVPGDSPTAQDRKALNEDLAGLLGGEYIDDDLGFEQSTNSSKPPPPYPGGEQSQALPGERGVVVQEDIPPVVPHTKEEVGPIVARAVDIFWTNRRYGESLEGVAPPPDFLSDEEDEETSDALTAQSRRSWKHMLFDLTGEIIRDIYKDEDKPDPPVWQKAKHKSHKFFKGVSPPTTVDNLQPVVQSAVFKLLDLNGTRKQHMVNKWNIRKKKDAVDAVLVQELGEEEKGWVDYNDDELNLKMQLADSLFDSLISDTVQTLNGIYQRRQHSEV